MYSLTQKYCTSDERRITHIITMVYNLGWSVILHIPGPRRRLLGMSCHVNTKKYNELVVEHVTRVRRFFKFWRFSARTDRVNVPDGGDTIAIGFLSVLPPVEVVDVDRPPTNRTKRERGTIVASARVLGRRPRPRSPSRLTVYGGGSGGIRFSVRKNNIGKK